MDNNELAQILLCEASELLTEGAQAEAYKARKNNDNKDNDKYIKKIITSRGTTTSLGYKPRSSVSYDTATKDPKYKNDLNTPLNTFIYNNYDKQRGIDQKIANKANKIAEKVTGFTNNDHKKAFNDDIYLNKERQKELIADATRRHLRRHNKKAYNESIAILLTEAAELLTEGARYKKEFKNPIGKSSNAYGKEAAKDYAKGLSSKADSSKSIGKLESNYVKSKSKLPERGRFGSRYSELINKYPNITSDELDELNKLNKHNELHRKINNR